MTKINKFDEYIEFANEAFYEELYLNAVYYYKKALAIKEIDADSYINLAECYNIEYLEEEAEVFLKKALELKPKYSRAVIKYADFLFYTAEKKDEAEEIYFKLLKTQPDDINIYIAFAGLYINYDENRSPDFEKAAPVLKEGIKKFPDAGYLSSKLLAFYAAWGNFKEAEKLFNKLLKNGKCTFNDYEEYTRFFTEENNTESLIKILKKCISNYPREKKYYKELISVYTETDNLDLIIAAYEQLFRIDCDDINNYYNLAEYLLEKAEINKATEYYKTAAKINYSIVLFKQAYIFSNSPFDHYIKAIELYKEAVELNPGNFKAYVNMGVCSGILEKHHESLSYYAKAIEINPHYDLPYENSGNAYRKAGDLNQAIEYYKKALKLNPQNYKVAGNLGVTYYSLEKYNEALKFYEISLKFSDNESIQAYYNIALLYNKLKKYKKAAESCQSELDLYNDYTPSDVMFNKYAIYYTLGLSNYYLKKKDDALTYFFKSLDLNENYKDTYVNIGSIYNDFGKLDLAKEYLNKALKMDPMDFCALENLGWTCYLEKDYVNAIKYTKKSVELNSKNADGFYNLGKIYSALKKDEQAAKMFKKATLLGHKNKSE